eukprot:gene3465-6894_t
MCHYTTNASQIWWTKPLNQNLLQIDDISDELKSVHLNFFQNPTLFCIYDSLSIKWSTSLTEEMFLLAVSVAGKQELALGSPQASSSTQDRAKSSQNDNYITCQLNEDHCIPSVKSISTMPNSSKLTILFTTDTNQPILPTLTAVNSTLLINPPITDTAKGIWLSPSHLEIEVNNSYVNSVLSAYTQGNIISVKVLTPEKPLLTGIETIRPVVHGVTSIFAVNATSLQRISNILTVEVDICNYAILPSLDIRMDNSVEEKRRAKSFIRYKGIVAITGTNPIRLRQTSIPSLAKGHWSLSFWVKLLDRPPGVYRSLFYKGDGGLMRTPSVWLLPNTNRMAVRASTDVNPDLGADTALEIPVNKWSLLTFSFENTTTETKNGYVISVYLNGKLDISLSYSDKVLPNEGELHMFKDPSHNGPRLLVNDVIVWDAPLTSRDVSALFARGYSSKYTKSIDTALSLVSHTPLLPNLVDRYKDHTSSSQSSSSVPLSLAGSSPAIAWDKQWDHATTIHTDINNNNNRIAETLMAAARVSLAECASMESRLDRYAEAAWFGSAEGLYLWAMLLAFGSETPDNGCGMETSMQGASAAASDLKRATYALIRASEMGYTKAIVPLSMMLLSGVGISALLSDESEFLGTTGGRRESLDRIPVPYNSEESVMFGELRKLILSLEENEYCNGDDLYVPGNELKLGSGILCRLERSRTSSSTVSEEDMGMSLGGNDPLTSGMVGLLHIAALHGVPEAQLQLMNRYRFGIGVLADMETAALYGSLAAAVAYESFHRVGGEPVVEADRIDDRTEKNIDKGRAGSNDDAIQHQIVRANEGDVPSMVSVGDMYYYGARGLPRDQTLALNYFDRAAATGDASGLCAAAAMYLKGEGTTEKDLTKAIAMYEQAAAMGAVRALNGLGYIYFYGQDVPKNETKAYGYFLAGAETESNSDSLFNAGFCLQNGIGATKNSAAAASFFQIAARKFGHFDSIHTLGNMHMIGDGVHRSSTDAVTYFNAAVNIGPWSGWLRRGLDQFLMKRYPRSLMCYVLAGELGFEVSQSNAAFILRRRLSSSSSLGTDGGGQALMAGGSPLALALPVHTHLPKISQIHHVNDDTDSDASTVTSNRISQKQNLTMNTNTSRHMFNPQVLSDRLYLRELALSAHTGSTDSAFAIANAFFHGQGVEKNCQAALWWYSKASSAGHSMSSVYLGFMHHFGICMPRNTIRAVRYYNEAIKSKSNEDYSEWILSMSLRWLAGLWRYSYTIPVASGIESTIQWYYKDFMT